MTSPARTLADLARVVDDGYADAARLMADADPDLAARTVMWLQERGALPNKRSALEVLRDLAAREDAGLRTT